LHAGSRSVVCSLWKVDDRDTMDLMVALYSELKRGKSVADAVREAKLSLLRDGQSPFQWAPFIVIGE
jgi:CHAT domain-containing protein